MRAVTLYECEICHQWFSDEAKALACEAQGEPTRYPLGLMWAARPETVRRATYYGLIAAEYLGHEAKVTVLVESPTSQRAWDPSKHSLTKQGEWLGEADAPRGWEEEKAALSLIASKLAAHGHSVTQWNGQLPVPYCKVMP